MKSFASLLALISINIAFAGWGEPVIVGATEYLAFPELHARNDSIFVIYEDKFIRSLDGGQTWQDQYVFENTGFLQYNDFQLNGDTLVVFNADAEFQFFFSTDFGETWQGPRLCGYFSPTYFCVSLNYEHQVIKMCFSQYNSDYLWSLHLRNSYDFGITWVEPESIWTETNGFNSKIYSYYGKTYIPIEIETAMNLSEVHLITQDSSGAWRSTFLFDGSGTTYRYYLAAGSNGTMAAVYQDWYSFTDVHSFIYIRTSSDYGETWGPIVDLSEGDHNDYPKVAISGDTVVVVWNTRVPQFLCRRSYDLGQTWQPLEVLNPEGVGEGLADIVIENGKIHMVFIGRDTAAVWYQCWEPDTYIDETVKPDAYSLSEVYPNPFNNQTVISYTLYQPSYVAVEIYDVLGREISTLVQQHQQPGEYQTVWNAVNQASGIYFVKINTDSKLVTHKAILLK